MLAYPRLGYKAGELVLCVRQGTGSRRLDRRRLRCRGLSQTAARIERTTEYRRSLNQVLELGQQFQGTLDLSQRQSWLALEDALLEHTSQLNRAYFQAGVELGSRASHARRGRDPRLGALANAGRALASAPPNARVSAPRSGGATAVSQGTEGVREREIIIELARLIRKLAAR